MSSSKPESTDDKGAATSQKSEGKKSSQIGDFKLTKKLGTSTLANLLAEKGYPLLARALRFHWTELLLLWNPEQPAQPSVRRAPRPLLLSGESQSIQRPRAFRVNQRGAGVRQQPRIQPREA